MTLGQRHAKRCGVLRYPREIFLSRGGVDHQAKKILLHEVDDQIVYHAARCVKHAAVERFAGLSQFCDIICQQITQKLAGPCAVQINDGHVRYIKHAGVAAHCVVLIDLRAVVQRHHPAVEVHHACTVLLVLLKQRRLLSHNHPVKTNKRGSPAR